LKRIFYNPIENRLRSGWRIIIITSILMAIILMIGNAGFGNYSFPLALAVVMAGLLLFGSKKIDHRPFSDYGITMSKPWLRDFVAGNLIAALAISFIILIHLGMDWINLNSVNFHSLSATFYLSLAFIFITMAAVSFWEEAYFRSYLITNLQEGLHFRKVGKDTAVILAVVLSSIFFGITHLGNPNATWISTLNISIAGMVFAYPYIITRSLAIPLGMHLSWNYFQGAVFGLPVSGSRFDTMMMTATTTGPESFTGGYFGPEAGAAGLLGLMILLTLNEIYISVFYKK
jgi:uncharacterized protein